MERETEMRVWLTFLGFAAGVLLAAGLNVLALGGDTTVVGGVGYVYVENASDFETGWYEVGSGPATFTRAVE